MHLAPLLRTISVLLIVVCAFMLFPMAFALYYGELQTIRFFFYPMAAVVLVATQISASFENRTAVTAFDPAARPRSANLADACI